MLLPSANEAEPYKEKYEARGYFEICIAMCTEKETKS